MIKFRPGTIIRRSRESIEFFRKFSDALLMDHFVDAKYLVVGLDSIGRTVVEQLSTTIPMYVKYNGAFNTIEQSVEGLISYNGPLWEVYISAVNQVIDEEKPTNRFDLDI